MNPGGLFDALAKGKCEACGGGPVITVLMALESLGDTEAVILKYANSGDVTGDHSRVVGYLAAGLFTTSDRDPHPK
jgi:AmmeMemoRadiSam system protein B